mgnify:CR=1 FL=1
MSNIEILYQQVNEHPWITLFLLAFVFLFKPVNINIISQSKESQHDEKN